MTDLPPLEPLEHPPTGGGQQAEHLDLLAAIDGDEALAPRARITNTLTVVLAVALVLVGVFVGGAWVQRRFGTTPSGAATTGPASANAAIAAALAARGGGALPGVAGNAPASTTVATTAVASDPGAAITGTVKLVDGTKVYVATADGTILIVTTTGSTPVQLVTSGTLADLKPGQTVVVDGPGATDGTVAARSIRQVPATPG